MSAQITVLIVCKLFWVSCWRQIKSSFWIISSTSKPNGSVFLRSTLCLMHLTSKPLHWASDVQLGILVFVKPVYKISQHWRGFGQVFNSPNFKTKCGHETLAEPHFGCLYESRCLKPMPIKVGLELGTSMSNELHPTYFISADCIWKSHSEELWNHKA